MPEIIALCIRLEVEEKLSLFVLLAADGTVNRLGRGGLQNQEQDVFVGRIDPAVFEAVRSCVSENILQSPGGIFRNANSSGTPCRLHIALQLADGTERHLEFLYGSESMGMPSDVVELVTAAVRETDAWYENLRRKAAGQ